MKVALIELNTIHEECLYTQAKFLKDSGFEVTLIIHPKLKKQIVEYENLIDNTVLFNFASSELFIRKVFSFFRLYKFIVKNNYKRVIFNTASSKLEIIFLSLFLPSRIKKIGTIHNLKKLNNSFSQKMISKKLKKYFVINDFLLDTVKIKDPTIILSSYYPIYFPYKEVKIENSKDDYCWICIPGEINYDRRDYRLVLEVAKRIKKQLKIKFLILGKLDFNKKDSQIFLKDVKENNLQEKFIFFDYFIENSIFHSYVKKSDFIMFPNTMRNDNYLKYKISGAFNLAFSYKKPLICHNKLKIIPDLNLNSLFYNNGDDLVSLIENIDKKKEFIKTSYSYSSEKWNYNEQRKKYISFID